MYKMVEQARQNKNNPIELFKQVTGNYTPQQMEGFKNFVHGFGITDEQLNKYGIDTKC